ncbi:virion morphogenesis protein [Parasalinivibrio latis]|uniref:virion morphogenesis protein n=1 Tax=Parasalinivibrio latis TaxID=2952610 RepID=UPI0030E0DAD5
MNPTVQINQQDALNLKQKLAMLALPPRKRTWILKTLGRWERGQVRKRIAQQKDIHGRALEPRKRKRKGKGKMFRRMAKGLEPYVKNGAKELDLTWKNKLTAKTASRHHLGQAQKMTARQMEKRWGKPDYSAPPPKGMARKLREVGYTIPNKRGNGRKKPSLKWIMGNMTQGQAGAIIRELSGKPDVTKWDIPLAERQILGSKQQNVNRQLLKIFEQAQKRK